MSNIWTPGVGDRQVQVHKQLPTATDVHLDAMLTDFSVQYAQEEQSMLASSVFPMKPVRHQTDKYPIWPKADFFRNEARLRAPGTPVQRGGYRLSSDSYRCDIYEWGTSIPVEVRRNADNWADLDQVATKYVMSILAIKREVEFCSTFMTTSVWGTDITGVASGPSTGQVVQWNSSSSTPIDDVLAGHRAIKLATGKRANTLVLGFDVWMKLLINTQILNRLVNGQTPGQIAQVTNADLANVFKVDRVVIAEAIYNTAAEGATASMSFIAGKVAWLGYVDPSPGTQSLTAGATFVWDGIPGASSLGTLIENRYDPNVKSDLIDGFASWSMKVTAADAGYFFTAIVA